jgi:hypothetical protein
MGRAASSRKVRAGLRYVSRLSGARISLHSAAARNYLAIIGATPFPSTPAELAAFQEADTKGWAEIVEIANIDGK